MVKPEMKAKFTSGDKVFAKVRGYPPWPAKVEGLADETPNKMRYHVYFYGTGETAVVKAEDIYYFVENKAKFGKPKKHKNFTEALAQIEAELTPEDRLKVSSLTAAAVSSPAISSAPATPSTEEPPKRNITVGNDPDENNVSTTEESKVDTSKPGSRRPSTSIKQPQQQPAIVKPLSPSSVKSKPKDKKRKIDLDTLTDDLEQKKMKPASSSSDTDSPQTVKTSPEVMSRSGRKIRPKRFADFDEGIMEEITQPKSTKTNKSKNSENSTEQKPEGDDYILAVKENEKFKIPLKINRPNFDSNKLAQEWDDMVLRYAINLKKRIENGDFSEPLEAHMDNWTKEKLQEFNPSSKRKLTVEDKNEYYNLESQLLEVDISIKESLSLKKADASKCLELLDQLYKMPVTPLMLKKHPELVNTVKKMRKYIGNTSAWSMTDDEINAFNESASLIREKADLIYNKFKSLFLLPSGQPFWDFFAAELAEFSKKTKHLSMEQVFAITEDTF